MEIVLFGFLFGVILMYAKLNRFNTISGLAILENLAVVKTIILAIGIGVILLSIEISLGYASYHIKPFMLGGILLGGLIFGTGMAILGYCPGTLAISVGEGSIDALIGVIGGLLGGLVYTLLLPSMQNLLGPDLGAISLNSLIESKSLFYLLIFIIGIVFIYISFWLNKKDQTQGTKWIHAGIALAILNVIIFSSFAANRPIGASTSFPYVADYVTGNTSNDYFSKIKGAGYWEVLFLSGAFLAGLILSLIKKEFQFKIIYSNWERFKGNSKLKRIIWSFIGGFILIFGARMAGGCTSGHILSGGMQLAISSLVFAVFTFIGLLVTGKYFYKK
jgi:uncharacterized membrane protein YedE/YeeE